MNKKLTFDENSYIIKELSVDGKRLSYRAYEGIVYVNQPIDVKYQSLNIYVPECFYAGEVINDYTLHTAPIFFPNTVGGYMPGLPKGPELNESGNGDTFVQALQRGYVVVCAGARGRGLVNEEGENLGVAPAHIVDLKAAIRYLKWNKNLIPGDVDKIISNGTSAGGALSSLLGGTGNHPDYEKYLQDLGAAPATDDIFAASCYCPITNLEHADMAYEWEFHGINEGHWWKGDFVLTDKQKELSGLLKQKFSGYVNGLRLHISESGEYLMLDAEGNGTLKDYIKHYVMLSAQKELEKGADMSGYDWMQVQDGRVISLNWEGYIKYRTRMKPVPAFDNISMGTPENELFGSAVIMNRHFTEISKEHSEAAGLLADAKQIKMMNPMDYIRDDKAIKAKHFRIRHGAVDCDTSLAISAMLTALLRMEGVEVDYFLPWGIAHAGDYDLEELFDWIDRICIFKETDGIMSTKNIAGAESVGQIT